MGSELDQEPWIRPVVEFWAKPRLLTRPEPRN